MRVVHINDRCYLRKRSFRIDKIVECSKNLLLSCLCFDCLSLSVSVSVSVSDHHITTEERKKEETVELKA